MSFWERRFLSIDSCQIHSEVGLNCRDTHTSARRVFLSGCRTYPGLFHFLCERMNLDHLVGALITQDFGPGILSVLKNWIEHLRHSHCVNKHTDVASPCFQLARKVDRIELSLIAP